MIYKYSRYDVHVLAYYKVKYCKEYGHPTFWDNSGICDYCGKSK